MTTLHLMGRHSYGKPRQSTRQVPSDLTVSDAVETLTRGGMRVHERRKDGSVVLMSDTQVVIVRPRKESK
jgi:ribosomal protein L14